MVDIATVDVESPFLLSLLVYPRSLIVSDGEYMVTGFGQYTGGFRID